MKFELEIDFTDKIKAQALDKLTYVKTPDIYLKTASSNFKHMDIDITSLLDFPFPANSSEETRKELREIKQFIDHDYPEDFKANLKQMDEDPAQFVIDGYENITGQKAPEDILKFVTGGDVEVLVMKLKMHYNRPRPYQIAEHYDLEFNYNKTVQNGAAHTPSYPSGHTLSAYFTAKALGYGNKKLEKELEKRAAMVAASRLAEGVHFRSDNDFSFYVVDQVLMPAFVEKYDRGRDS